MDWRYWERDPENLNRLREAAFISILFLFHFGDKKRTSRFYSDLLLEYFPGLDSDFETRSTANFHRENDFHLKFYIHMFNKLLPFFGLGERTLVKGDFQSRDDEFLRSELLKEFLILDIREDVLLSI